MSLTANASEVERLLQRYTADDAITLAHLVLQARLHHRLVKPLEDFEADTWRRCEGADEVGPAVDASRETEAAKADAYDALMPLLRKLFQIETKED